MVVRSWHQGEQGGSALKRGASFFWAGAKSCARLNVSAARVMLVAFLYFTSPFAPTLTGGAFLPGHRPKLQRPELLL